ncbi:MAG TPA: orotate phosphoribosyltransferase [Dehalococcoidia bacterium]|jgi:orotate phosphoribosyltransferase|nr:orotate phosphoribosyltransferase [Dehalococcoidia bacterium]
MSPRVERILEECGALLEGHFLLTSGRHSPKYLEKFHILQYPHLTQYLCSMMADHFRGRGIEVVAGPTVGGVVLAFEVARQLEVRAIFAEREGEGRAFKRGFTLNPGEQVLVVDDILTTGGSIREVMTAVENLQGKTAGVAVLVDRSERGVDFGVPLFSCHKLSLPTYAPEECPLCALGVPLTKLGGRPT